MAEMRQFETGATRDQDTDKFDYEGFLSPAVLQRFAEYMHENRLQSDGQLRDSDNWQKGIPKEAYMKSLLRHVMDVWLDQRGQPSRDDVETSLCAVMFNAMGLLFELMQEREDGTEVEGGPTYDPRAFPYFYQTPGYSC